MSSRFKICKLAAAVSSFRHHTCREGGNVLVYVVMVMVIFAVLGVTMVSLFSTAGGSAATANETRRAFFASESGIRYAMSELRSNSFSETTIDRLNDTTYNLKPEGRFTLNVFGAWFDSLTDQSVESTGVIRLNTAKGKLPKLFFDKIDGAISELHLINYDYISLSGGAVAKADSYTPYTGVDTYFDINIIDDFFVGKNETVCLAFPPAAAASFVPTGGSYAYLDLKPEAKHIFPKTEGAFELGRRIFFYRGTEEGSDYFRLNKITAQDGITALVSVSDSDRIILAPRNYYLASNGWYGDVTYEFDINKGVGVADLTSLKPGSRKPDIEFEEEADLESVLSQVKPGTTPDFVTVNNVDKFLTIGGGGPSLGAVWFRDTRNIGGIREFCNDQGCFFSRGIRVFFTLEYTGSGEGLIFALINGNTSKNDIASAGGDIEQSELLGYSGDSRLNTAGTLFLDNSGPEKGLIPPKIGLEFDTKINYSSALEGSLKYCSDSNLNANTRNDPGSSGKDAVQYVFWGNSALDIPCREEPYCGAVSTCKGDPSYDDNRHNAIGDGTANWTFSTSGPIYSAPALATDGTIYIGSNDTRLFAINPDGTQKWHYHTGAAVYTPTVSAGGTIYVGSGNAGSSLGVLNAFNPDGSLRLSPFATAGPVTTKPTVNSNTIFIGSDDGNVYAISSSTGLQRWRFDTGAEVKSSPALSSSGNTVYFGSLLGTFYALDASTGGFLWSTSGVGAIRHSSPVVGPDGTVYVGSENGRLYAFNGATGSVKWSYLTGAAIWSSPAVGPDGTVYVGSFDDYIYSIAPDGSLNWRFRSGGDIQSRIAVDANGHVYFGSSDRDVYALYKDGSVKWRFPAGGAFDLGGPALKDDGTVYIGSLDYKLYAINQFANPKNYRDRLITSYPGSPDKVGGTTTATQVEVDLESTDNWLKGDIGKRQWAVRMEVTRSLSASGGTYAYTLKTWLRQCDQPSCNDVLGTFYEDTRIEYSPTLPTARPAQLVQTINLALADHQDFDRFLFGFTSQAAAGDLQTATIRKFKLSFIRPGDPTVTNDPNWP